ncbi:MAG: DUF2079 domain-containing protein [Vicingaceae bacterium]
MLGFLHRYWEERPLRLILLLSILFRTISVILSQGYGMHDDHFLVIEAAQSWIDGFDYNNWLPKNATDGKPTGHSFFYVGLHYLLFYLLTALKVLDPQVKMLLVRAIHALLSLTVVYIGFGLTERLSGRRDARIVGVLLGLYWFFPILSVRNMVEMVCIPFSMISFWYLIRLRKKESMMRYVLAGFFIGISIGIRTQMYLFLGGMGLAMLFRKEIIGAVIFGLSAILSLFLTQSADLFLWGKPFAEMAAYIEYNSTHYADYITQSPFQYVLVLAGLLIPPVSLFLLFGFFREWKKHLLIFLPGIIFIAFHSIYPNKQERFILPVIPYLIILGVIGWNRWMKKSNFWKKRVVLYKTCIGFFIVLNVVALLFVSPASTKKSRVDTSYYLGQQSNVEGILLERSEDYSCYMLPRYYSGDWTSPQICYSRGVRYQLSDPLLKEMVLTKQLNYVLFIEERNIEERLERFTNIFPNMRFKASFEPSYIDKLLHYLNPVNQNETIYVYEIPTEVK